MRIVIRFFQHLATPLLLLVTVITQANRLSSFAIAGGQVGVWRDTSGLQRITFVAIYMV